MWGARASVDGGTSPSTVILSGSLGRAPFASSFEMIETWHKALADSLGHALLDGVLGLVGEVFPSSFLDPP